MLALPIVALLAASTPAPRTVVVVGDAEIAVPPLMERKFKGRVASITVEPIPDKKNEWKLTYARYEHQCTLVGRGPADNIRITPGQRCHAQFEEAELRGRATSIVDSGALVVDPKTGVAQLDLRARIVADVERFVAVTVLGRSFQQWVPVPTPTGQARFTGRTVAD